MSPGYLSAPAILAVSALIAATGLFAYLILTPISPARMIHVEFAALKASFVTR